MGKSTCLGQLDDTFLSPEIEAIPFIILQICFTTYAVLQSGEYHQDVPQFKLGLFIHMTRLNQLHAS